MDLDGTINETEYSEHLENPCCSVQRLERKQSICKNEVFG